MKEDSKTASNRDISIVLCGQAGQGIQTVEFLLTRIIKFAGCNVFATKEYMSRIRGGSNSTEIRLSPWPVSAFVDRMDILIGLDKAAFGHVRRRISSSTFILAEKENLPDDFNQADSGFVDVPFTKTAEKVGDKIYSNIVAVGAITGLLQTELQLVTYCVKRFFAAKGDNIVQKNLQAVEAGYRIGGDLYASGRLGFGVEKNSEIRDQILLSGTEAVALGAIAGGCNFISAYPMSPSTGVLTFLAKHAARFGIIAEQAEDEIAAINMAIGAWYAGARAMVSTSGGGFALMTEGISLAAMLEVPVVVMIGQRPGPATGLPTRTEQGDLELALYAGHGEFPRIILAPGRTEDGFYLTQKAFNLADRFQVPVIILTDQYFMDSYYNIAPFDLSGMSNKKHVVKTDPDYKRYNLTADGISPRGIPAFGDGLVVVDSDEHDENGHITEDLDLRVQMVDKRLKKADSINDQIIPPQLIGPDDYQILMVCWGSTYSAVCEAAKSLSHDRLAILHFSQVYPLHSSTVDYLRKAEQTVIIENNATSQFGRLIKIQTGIDIGHKILKYNGLPFSVEEIIEKLSSILG